MGMDAATQAALLTLGLYAFGMGVLVLLVSRHRQVSFGETAKRHELSLCGIGAVGLFHGLSGPQSALLVGGSLSLVAVIMWVCALLFPQKPVAPRTPKRTHAGARS